MPDDNPILRHWQAELLVFQKNFLLLHEQMNEEAIHDLRVAIKKLRSYFKLFTALFKKNDTGGSLAGTRELFSVLGRHRNIEISKQLLLSFAGKNKPVLNPLLIYLQLLQDQISDFCRQALQQYEKKELDELTTLLEQNFENLGTEETLNKVRDVIASSVENVQHNLKHFKNKFHLIRKHLKDIFYWAKIFDSEIFFTKSQIKIIDKALTLLGNIQDHEVMITNLKYFRKTILSNSITEYDLIKKIETRAKKKKERLLERANKMTDKLTQEL